MKVMKFLALAAIALFTASCSDDDDEKVISSKVVEGTYTGNVIMSVGKPMDPVAGTAKLTAQADGRLTLVLPEANMGGDMALPALTLTNVEINQLSDTEFTLSLDTINVTANGMNMVGTGLEGNVKGNVLRLNYDIKPGAMPFAIKFDFTGNK